MKHAIFDENGFPQGFYSEDIHGDNIPPEAIEITDEQWEEFLGHQGRRKWDGSKVIEYTPPAPTPEETRAAMPPLTARQLRLGLVGGGFSLADVEATIDAIPDAQQKAVAQIEWEYAVQFERMHPLIEQVGSSLGLTPEQIDAMWGQALEL